MGFRLQTLLFGAVGVGLVLSGFALDHLLESATWDLAGVRISSAGIAILFLGLFGRPIMRAMWFSGLRQHPFMKSNIAAGINGWLMRAFLHVDHLGNCKDAGGLR